MDLACGVCGSANVAGVAALPFLPMSDALCRRCCTAGAVPFRAAVFNTADIGGLNSACPEWKAVVEATLALCGRTREEFNFAVSRCMREDRGAFRGGSPWPPAQEREHWRFMD